MKKIFTPLIVLFFSVQFTFSQSSPIVQNILNQVNQDSIMYFVKQLSGVVPAIVNGSPYTIVSRNKYQPGNDMAGQYIKQKLEYYGLTAFFQAFGTGGTGKNVYAVQPGTTYPNKKYIICAHFDDMPTGTTAPGADDNGSGTAAVIEAARILSDYSFPYTIIYALWDEEEQGLIGSAYYAQQAAAQGDSILGVINMDMISWESNGDNVANIHTRSVGSSISLYNKMIEMNTTYSIGLTLTQWNPGETYSDHASFWSNGYGAILLIEDDADFNAYYHTVNDLIQYFDIPYFVKMAKLSFATLATFALDLNLSIQHTPIASFEYTGEIQTSAVIQTGLAIGTGTASPRLYYRVNSGSGYSEFYSVQGVDGEVTGTYYFTIPPVQSGSSVQYYIAAQDSGSTLIITLPSGGSGFNPPGSVPPSQFYQFYVAPEVIVFADSANNTTSWVSSGGWATTTNKYVSPPTSFTESPAGNYTNNLTASLTSTNNISLAGALGVTLEFDTQWNIETDWDYGQIRISTNNGSTWTALQGLYTNPGTGSFQPPGQPLYDGVQSAWVREKIDLSAYIGSNVKIQFYFRTDGSQVYDGWYVDNISIKKYAVLPTLNLTVLIEGLFNGTSIIPDTATVELRNSIAPYSIVESKQVLLNTLGAGSGKFGLALNGIPYYVVVKHHNSIETWSALTQQFTSGVLSL